MADKKKTDGGSEKDTKATDKAAGKKAKAKAEVQAEAEAPQAAVVPAPPTKSAKIPKLAKKNKQRLPRREKKARQKAAL